MWSRDEVGLPPRPHVVVPLALALVAAVFLAAPAPPALAADDPAIAAAPSDFDGDGMGDLAVGVPFEDVPAGHGASIFNAGAVEVIYGSQSGLTSDRDQLVTQCVLFCPSGVNPAQAGDQFGNALSTGDFDSDGFADLAIGIPGDEVGSPAQHNAGAVQVLYGSAAGLSTADGQYLQQCGAFCGLGDSPEEDDLVGWSLASSDFNLDGFADLAVGAPSEDLGAVEDAGLVTVLYGSSSGLRPLGRAAGPQVWHQNTTDIAEFASARDHFGFSLAVADLGRGAHADLTIGVPLEDLDGDPIEAGEEIADAGAVNVIFGTSSGLRATGNQLVHEAIWTSPTDDLPTHAEGSDAFGFSLAAANFGNGPRADLAASAPFEDVGASSNTGAVVVFDGSDSGLTGAPRAFMERPPRNATSPRSSTMFGVALAAANFGNGQAADLAVGQPRPIFDRNGAGLDPGSVAVIYGSAAGLTSAGRQLWSQAGEVEDDPENGDLFGFSLTAANFGRGAGADLAIGVQLETVPVGGGTVKAGAVNVLYSVQSGLSPVGDQLWTQETPGIEDVSEEGDVFGCLGGCFPWVLFGPFPPVGDR